MIVLAIAACGSSAREKTLHATLVSLDATSAAFVSWDASKQDAIVAAATSEADGIAKLTAYKASRAKLVGYLEAAYRTLAAAAVLDGSADGLSKAVSAAAQVAAAWDALRGGAP